MTTQNIQNLPPELQARINDIVAGAQQQAQAPAPEQPAPPSVRPPSLMDHVIALRQEVAMLSQQVQASAQVTEAVGQAVGQMYAMFQPSAGQPTQGASYSENFQQSVDETDY